MGHRERVSTTLHPLLAYQNVTDGPLSSISNPGHTWTDYSLGRATYGNLIPKDTTAANACGLPTLTANWTRCHSSADMIVSASDFSVNVGRPITVERYMRRSRTWRRRFESVMLKNRPLVSSTPVSNNLALSIETSRRRPVHQDRVWYDNEWSSLPCLMLRGWCVMTSEKVNLVRYACADGADGVRFPGMKPVS